MAAVSSPTGQARPAAPMATADLEAAIAALPGRKQRLRESFDRVVACAPPHFHLPFTWDDIDAHVSSLHASLSLRFGQMQQQPHPGAPVSAAATHDDEQPHPGAPVSAAATHDDEQPHPGAPVSATATRDDEQPHHGAPVSPTHDDESIQEDEEMVREDEDASPVQDGDEAEMVREDEDASPVQDGDEAEMVREDAGMGSPCRQARGTRDQEFPVPMRARAPHAGSPMLRQPYTECPPDVLSQLNLQRQQPYMQAAYQQEFPAMAPVAMNNYNIPLMVQQPYYNIPPMVQQPYYAPYFRQEFFPDSRQEFFPDVTRQPPIGVDHVLQQQYMAMVHHQPHFPQQQYTAHHEHHFSVPQAASAHGQGSKAKRRRQCRTTNTDAINVHISEPSKESRTIHKHDAKPNPNHEPFQKKTIYDYF